ncbi:MAG: ABC transporter ATP-binding protein [Planctomycetota bacterium]
MDQFWNFARDVFRFRVTVGLALLMATLSAGGLGVGVAAITPVSELILRAQSDDEAERQTANLRSVLSEVDQQRAVDAAESGEAVERIVPLWAIEMAPEGTFTSVVVLVGGLGVLTILGGIANFLHQFFALNAVFRGVANIRRKAFRHMLRAPLSRIVTGGPSDMISRIVGDTNALAGGFSALLGKGVAQVSKGVAGLIAAFVLDWRLTLFALIIAPILYTIIRRLGKRIRRASRAALKHNASLFGATSESLQGLRVVKVHTTERFEQGRFNLANKQVVREQLRARTARALASPLVEVVTIIAVGALLLIATKAIIDGAMELPNFVGAMSALAMAGASAKPLSGIISDIQASSGAADRLAELMDTKPEPGHERGLPRLPRHSESVEFRSVTFGYPGADEPALRDVSLSIRKGETVAFVGPNGSGKTTLLAMVPRLFEPDSGSVLLDGIDIAECSLRSLRAQIGVVTQETVLFRGTIRSNIAYGARGATDQQVEDAVRRARAEDFIARLPDGLDTPVGEQGLTLSGGQRQRIAIARAILRDPALLILDEATSMIDADSEARIAEAIDDFGKGRTCLVVAHRLSTVMTADRIVVMDRGRLIDAGSHADLLERCAVYQQIARTQLVPGKA